MPRIRVRTPDGERVVGTRNCSTLTIKLVAHAQRSTLRLSADAQLAGGDNVIEHWSWDFPEMSDRATISLASEPGDDPLDLFYDPPDASHSPKIPIRAGAEKSLGEIQAVERELEQLENQLIALGAEGIPRRFHLRRYKAGTLYCSFCGKSLEEVQKLVAGPAVYICDECIQIASDITAD